MDDDELSDERIEQTVAHGRKNQRTMTLVSNWCQHARIERSPGRGLIEQWYGVPIGHMGVRCQYTPAGGMMCWDLEDGFLAHYERNCRTCEKRSPGRGQDMQPIIDEYEERKRKSEEERNLREAKEERELSERRQERDKIFDASDPVSGQIRDLLEAVDQHGDRDARAKLIDFAKLAPDAFSVPVQKYLEKLALNNQFRLGPVAADVLLTLPENDANQLDIALAVCSHGMSDLVAECLADRAAEIPTQDFEKVVGPLIYRAFPYRSLGDHHRIPDPKPLLTIAEVRGEDLSALIGELLDGNDAHKVDAAARIVSVVTPYFPHVSEAFPRDIIAKLLRHKHLLPELSRQSLGDGLAALQEAATTLFEVRPEQCDAIISSLQEGAGRSTIKEAGKIYAGVLRTDWDAPAVECTSARATAFKRLLWMAAAEPTNFDNPGTNFFGYVDKRLINIAAEQLDALIGAAATLSQALEEIDREPLLQEKTSWIDEVEKSNRRGAVHRLQGSLVEWAFLAVRNTGKDGVQRILDLFEAIPETELQFRANIVAHLGLLGTTTAALNLVLPHLYTALTHPEAIIRGSAAQAIGDAPHEVRRDFPDLIFDVYVALLTDPNVYVHKSALRSLRSYSFPEHLKGELRQSLTNLIIAYSREGTDDDFLVECIQSFVSGFLTESEIEGGAGRAILKIIEGLQDISACKAIEHLRYSLRNTEGFARVVAKFLNSDWSNRVGQEALIGALFLAPSCSLAEVQSQLMENGRRMGRVNPYYATDSIVLLAKAGAFSLAQQLCNEIIEGLPQTREMRSSKAYLETLQLITSFEASLPKRKSERERFHRLWNTHLDKLRKIRSEDDADRGHPPIFFR